MISYLRGRVVTKEDKFIIIDVGGIGFKVFLASSCLSRLSKSQKETALFCSLKSKRDSSELYGFPSLEELKLFEFLTGLSGIGPKNALEISSLGSLNKLRKGIKEDDREIMRRLFKAGEKKAQAIIFEISRELKAIDKRNPENDDLLKALLKLGFSREEIKEAVNNLPKKDLSIEEKMEKALKILGKAN